MVGGYQLGLTQLIDRHGEVVGQCACTAELAFTTRTPKNVLTWLVVHSYVASNKTLSANQAPSGYRVWQLT